MTTPTDHVPPGTGPGPTPRRGWVGVASVALGSFAIVLSELLPVGLLPAIASELDVRVGTAGLMVVVTGLFAALAAPVVTVAASGLDRRVVLVGLSALLIASNALAALAPTFGVLLLGRVLLGISLGGFWATGAGIAGRLVPPTDTIRATALITGGISVATVVSLPLGAAVSALTSWRVAFVIGGLIGLTALGLQLLTLPRIPAAHRVRVSTLGALFRVPRARVGLLAAAFAFAAQFAASTYVAPFLQDRAGAGPGTVTLGLLAFGVAGVAGNFAAGVTLSRSVIATTGAAKVVLAATVVLLPLLAHSTVAVLALLVVWGSAWGALPLAMQTWMSTASPAGVETGLALFVTTIQLALAAGSVLGGAVVTSAGLDADFRLAGAIALAGAVAFIALGSRRAADPTTGGTSPAAPRPTSAASAPQNP
ncbi:MFS transporter [Kineococcus aurantiacus]|uniref:Putative MFS family arabinose efflux permease n=1 Tax=Kineococcus aurantiacus TaxID=37633 RepID=A0A7Y9DQK9_9ACTN|nr:putative MFS family arabinose efflux permease [Kineococcus aurantiacus]